MSWDRNVGRTSMTDLSDLGVLLNYVRFANKKCNPIRSEKRNETPTLMQPCQNVVGSSKAGSFGGGRGFK